MESQIEVFAQFGQTLREEVPDGGFGHLLDGNLVIAAGAGCTAVDEHADWGGHLAGAVPDLAGAAEQGELVEVMVQYSAEVLQRVAAVGLRQALRELVSEGVWMAQALPLDNRRGIGAEGPGLDYDAATANCDAAAVHDELPFVSSGVQGCVL